MDVNPNSYMIGALGGSQDEVARSKMESIMKTVDRTSEDSVDKAAKDFESVFLSQMLSHMFEGVDEHDYFNGGNAEKTWRGMLVDEYGKVISNAGGIGIADHVKAELLKLQEVQHGNAA
jgi:Rod binding domain-containing protein